MPGYNCPFGAWRVYRIACAPKAITPPITVGEKFPLVAGLLVDNIGLPARAVPGASPSRIAQSPRIAASPRSLQTDLQIVPLFIFPPCRAESPADCYTILPLKVFLFWLNPHE